MIFVIAESHLMFSSESTPVFNKIIEDGTVPNFKHKRKFNKHSVLSNCYNTTIQLKIHKVNGDIRLEHLCLPLNFQPKESFVSYELSYETDFKNIDPLLFDIPVEVHKWNYHCTKIQCIFESDNSMEISKVKNHKNIKTLLSMQEIKEKCKLILLLSDDNVKENVTSRITVDYMFSDMHEKYAPHQYSSIKIQNLCGHCKLPYEITFAVDDISKKNVNGNHVKNCENVCMLSGTYVLSQNRFQVHFRGSTSLIGMQKDLKIITGMDISDMNIYVYMVVLKGNIGQVLYFNSNNSYLQTVTKDICTCTFRFDDVCDIMELSNFRWHYIEKKWGYVLKSKISSSNKLSFNISRKGSTVVRMAFEITKENIYNLSDEENLVCDCNVILNMIHYLLQGKMLD